MDLEISSHTMWKSRYHFVSETKYKHQILVKAVSKYLKKVIEGMCQRYEYIFDCVGTDGDHVHLFIGAHPSASAEVVIKTIKSISAKEIFKEFPSLRKLLWGGHLWSIGYYWETIGDNKPEEIMRQNVLNQGTKEDKTLVKQLKLI